MFHCFAYDFFVNFKLLTCNDMQQEQERLGRRKLSIKGFNGRGNSLRACQHVADTTQGSKTKRPQNLPFRGRRATTMLAGGVRVDEVTLIFKVVQSARFSSR